MKISLGLGFGEVAGSRHFHVRDGVESTGNFGGTFSRAALVDTSWRGWNIRTGGSGFLCYSDPTAGKHGPRAAVADCFSVAIDRVADDICVVRICGISDRRLHHLGRGKKGWRGRARSTGKGTFCTPCTRMGKAQWIAVCRLGLSVAAAGPADAVFAGSRSARAFARTLSDFILHSACLALWRGGLAGLQIWASVDQFLAEGSEGLEHADTHCLHFAAGAGSAVRGVEVPARKPQGEIAGSKNRWG